MDLSKDVDERIAFPSSDSQLESMGFSRRGEPNALRVSGKQQRRRASGSSQTWTISDGVLKAERELEEKEQAGRDASSTDATTTNEIIDGKGEYELFGVVSHMGSNTGVVITLTSKRTTSGFSSTTKSCGQ